MIGIMHDPIVFLSESESPGIQEFVEEGEIHFVAHGTSSLRHDNTLQWNLTYPNLEYPAALIIWP